MREAHFPLQQTGRYALQLCDKVGHTVAEFVVVVKAKLSIKAKDDEIETSIPWKEEYSSAAERVGHYRGLPLGST